MSRIYLVTGSTSGIGRATKELLENRGHRVVGVSREGAEIDADLADPAQRADLADRVAERTGGRLDAVIANAGSTALTAAGMEVNFFGARDVLDALQPLLSRSSAPRAVAVTSISVVHPHDRDLTDALVRGDRPAALARADQLVEAGRPGLLYTSAKRALAEWVRAEALTSRWAGAGIALNAMAPGTIVTPMTAANLDSEQGRDMLRKTVPMPLNGPALPEVTAYLLAWMTSEENSHLAGQSIFLDGGAEATLRGPQVFDGASFG